MNKPSHPVIATNGGSVGYDEDAHAWALTQAEFFRSGQIDRIDWVNVAEEIEDVARRERRAAESALRVLMLHILKWQLQPERRSRSWMLPIKGQRLAYAETIGDNPSLKPLADEMRERAFAHARIDAAREMNVDEDMIPTTPPSWEALLEESFAVA